jgi:hypothetical protein
MTLSIDEVLAGEDVELLKDPARMEAFSVVMPGEAGVVLAYLGGLDLLLLVSSLVVVVVSVAIVLVPVVPMLSMAPGIRKVVAFATVNLIMHRQSCPKWECRKAG